jgi:hypothetical protein
MDTNFNPLLDENDDEIVTPKGDGRPGSEFWGRPKTAEKIAADKALRAQGIVPPGQKKERGRSVWNTKDFTIVQDTLQFQIWTANQIALRSGVRYETVNARLKALQKAGILDCKADTGARLVWFAKKKAVTWLQEHGQELPEQYSLIKTGNWDYAHMPHTLAVNQVVAQLLAGKDKHIANGNKVPASYLITEKRMQKNFPSANFAKDTQWGAGTLAERDKLRAAIKLQNGTLSYKDLLATYPILWTLTTKKGGPVPACEYSAPDLVLNLEKHRDSSNRKSIAIEVELHEKSLDHYKRIMETYRQDKLVYTGVIWYLGSPRFEKRIRKAAEEVGYPAGKLHFAPLLGLNGAPYSGTYNL